MGKATSPQLYWAPDKDPSWNVNPGVLTEVRNVIPTSRGTLTSYACTAADRYVNVNTLAAVTSIPKSAAIVGQLNGNARLIVGGDAYLWEAAGGGGFTDVSRTAGGPYAASEWAFAAYGNWVLATAAPLPLTTFPSDIPQFSSGGAFANLAGCTLYAGLVAVNKAVVVLANLRDTLGNIYPDAWAISGNNNPGAWCANLTVGTDLATGAAYGRTLHVPGPMRGLVSMRDTVVGYKPDGMVVGRLTGNPLGMDWAPVSYNVGSGSHNNVAVVNGVHYFLHRTGVYRFDGSFPQNIGTGLVNEYLARKLQDADSFYTFAPRAVVDDAQNLIYWFIGTNERYKNTGGYVNAGLVLNYVTGQFGWIDAPYQDAVPAYYNFGCPVVASRELQVRWDRAMMSCPGIIVVGNQNGVMSLRVPAVGRGSLGTGATSTIITGDIGDEDQKTLVSRLDPRMTMADPDSLMAGFAATVDTKPSAADLYGDEGMSVVVNVTAQPALAIGALTTYNALLGGAPYYVVQAGDYLAFEYRVKRTPSAGITYLTTGLRVLTTVPATTDYVAAASANNQWVSISVAMTADVGRTLSAIQTYLAVSAGPPATGTYEILFRRVRITDSAGTLRRRIYLATEERVGMASAFPTLTSATGTSSGAQKCKGVTFDYDSISRRFVGAANDRFHRATITLPGAFELQSLDIEIAPAGTM